MRSPPILCQSDDEAEMSAARAQAQGEMVISTHLCNHLEHNPGRSSDYVTWVSTLHPENADVTVDQRFFIPGNPWWRIYEEQVKQHQHQNEIPSATAVPVNDDLLATDGDTPSNTTSSSPPPVPPPFPPPPHWCLQFSPVDLFTGFFLSLMACFGVFLSETMALVFYFVAALFYWMAKAVSPPNPFTGILYSFLMLFYYSFALADSCTLLASSVLTEAVAAASWIASFCVGGVLRANEWHQLIRRTCHLIRAVFRKPFLEPPRHFCIIGSNKSRIVDEESLQNGTVVADPTSQEAEPCKKSCDMAVADGAVMERP